jgi:acetyl esterase/lipase
MIVNLRFDLLVCCRAEYDPEHDLLEKKFMMKGRWYQRKDLEVKNSRGDVLQCSHYMPVERPEGKPLPCVIYCHGNRYWNVC